MGKRRLTRPGSTKERKRTRSRWMIWAVIGGVVLVAGGAAVYLMSGSSGDTARTGSAAPDFTLRLLNGQSLALSSLRGRPVLVNFWHST